VPFYGALEFLSEEDGPRRGIGGERHEPFERDELQFIADRLIDQDRRLFRIDRRPDQRRVDEVMPIAPLA
jgi:hypothetical protein